MKSIREYIRQLPRVVAATAAVAVVAGSLSISDTARAGGTLRIGMTAADIPLSWGQPDQGFEGFRFMLTGLQQRCSREALGGFGHRLVLLAYLPRAV